MALYPTRDNRLSDLLHLVRGVINRGGRPAVLLYCKSGRQEDMLLWLPIQLEVRIPIPLITYGSLKKRYHHRPAEGKVPTCSPIHIWLVRSVSVFKCKLRYRRYCSPYGNKWPVWKKTHQPPLFFHSSVPDCSREVPHRSGGLSVTASQVHARARESTAEAHNTS